MRFSTIRRTGLAVALASAGFAIAAGASPARIVDPGGCLLTAVTDAGPGELHFQFEGASADGRHLLVAWEKGGDRGAYILDLETRRRSNLPGLNNAGVFSRDGKRLLVANNLADGTTDIVEYEIGTGATAPIAPHPRHEFLATYAPGGIGILFNSNRTGRSDLYLAPPEGEPIRLTDFDGYEAHAAFAPDASRILFHRRVGDGDYDILQLEYATGLVTPFISGPGEQSYPSWSQDGRRVAYASDEDGEPGKTDIFVADSSGSRIARITRWPGYDAYPSWSPDGRRLYFNSERADGTRNVYYAEIDPAGRCVTGAAAPDTGR